MDPVLMQQHDVTARAAVAAEEEEMSTGVEDASSASAEASPLALRIAERVRRIWRQYEIEQGRSISYRVLVREIVERGIGNATSITFLSNLTQGKAPNPSIQIFEILGAYFGVDPAYFITPDETLAEELLLRRHIAADSQLASIINRLKNVSPNAKQLVATMIDYLQTHEVWDPRLTQK